MKLRDAMQAYGTSEGVTKSWEVRRRRAQQVIEDHGYKPVIQRNQTHDQGVRLAEPALITTFSHPNGKRVTLSGGPRKQDNWWAHQNARGKIARGKVHEMTKLRQALKAYGTSEGVSKSWQSRERGSGTPAWMKSPQDFRRISEQQEPKREAQLKKEEESWEAYQKRTGGLTAQGQYGESGWQYGHKMDIGYIPKRTASGFPRGGGRGAGVPALPKQAGPPKISIPRPKMGPPQMPKIVKPTHYIPPKLKMPKPPTIHAPNPSSPSGSGLGVRRPNPSMGRKRLEAEMGEPAGGGAFSHAHVEPVTWFRPPSAVAREKGNHRIPTDNPGEKDDRFLDVTKRRAAFPDRMKLLKRSIPGGNPPLIPIRTTAVEQNSGVYMPSALYASRIRKRGNPGMFVAYSRRGVI